MALREIFSLVQANYDIAAATQLHAGQAVMRDYTVPTGMTIIAADRAALNASSIPIFNGAYAGILADDTARTGNTMIQVDPVGANYISGTGTPDGYGNVIYPFVANNNGMYSAQKRALGDFQAEDVTNVTDLTSGASGYQGPRRGVGVYTSPSTVLIIDSVGYAQFHTADTLTGSYAWTDTAWSGSETFAPGDLLTVGTTTNAGKLIRIQTNGVTGTVGSLGRAVARVDKFDAAAGLLQITLL